MHIDRIIASADRPVFSFEFFPPKTDDGERNLRETLVALRELEPDFASVTYGAGGTTRDRTLEITKWLKSDLGIESMHHLTCVGASADDLRATLSELQAAGIENVLALRGDPPAGATAWEPHPDGLAYSSELIDLIRTEFPSFAIGAAAFPEVHPQATDPLSDLQYLKAKVDHGAGFLVTNLFYDNEAYFRFVEAARFAGIEVPIVPGIMPITNVAQIKKITGLCGARIPAALLSELERRAEQPEAVAELGVAYATLQCAELLTGGAPGIHFYTMNRSPATRAILTARTLLQPWRSAQTPLRADMADELSREPARA
jgi:methylenetetrahydrofolate reductase (NADPH)